MLAFWFGVLLGSAGLAVALWLVRGASDLSAPAERQETLAEALWEDAAAAELALIAERERADELAAAMGSLLFGSSCPMWVGVDRATAALAAHDAARAAEVPR